MKDTLEQFDSFNAGKTYMKDGEQRQLGQKYGMEVDNYWHGFSPFDDVDWLHSGKGDYAFLSVMAPILRNSLVQGAGPLMRPDFTTARKATHEGSPHLGYEDEFIRDPSTGERPELIGDNFGEGALAGWEWFESPAANYAMWSMGGSQLKGAVKGIGKVLEKAKPIAEFFKKTPLPTLMKQWGKITPKAIVG